MVFQLTPTLLKFLATTPVETLPLFSGLFLLILYVVRQQVLSSKSSVSIESSKIER